MCHEPRKLERIHIKIFCSIGDLRLCMHHVCKQNATLNSHIKEMFDFQNLFPGICVGITSMLEVFGRFLDL